MSTVAIKAPPLSIARNDFPTWLPAMLVKELRQGLRARAFVGALVLYQVAMALVVVAGVADASSTFNFLQGAYWGVLGVVLLVVTPLRAITGLQAEIESRTVDLLLLTRLNAWRIVAGKWLSLVTQAVLLVVASLPYGVARYFFGSVEVTTDVSILGGMLGGCALLTAMALWASGLPKVVRILVGIGAFVLAQSTSTTLFYLFNPAYGMRPALFRGMNTYLFCFNCVLWFGLCMIGAVRRLAPPATNLSPALRLLPLLGFLPLPFLSRAAVTGQLISVAILGVIVAVLELARTATPMPCHWRQFQRRGAWARAVARLMMPGWASAFEWLMVLVAGALLGAIFTTDPGHIIRIVLTGAGALALPALAISFLRSDFPQRTAGYGLILGVGSLISAVAAGISSGTPLSQFTDGLLLVLPISGFWWSVNLTSIPSDGVAALQAAVACAVLGATWWRGQSYRRQLREFAMESATAPVKS